MAAEHACLYGTTEVVLIRSVVVVLAAMAVP